METQAVEQQGGQPQRRPKYRWPKGKSGNPYGTRGIKTLAAALFEELAPQFQPLDAVERVLLLQACTLSCRSRRTIDPDASVRMASEARRTLEGLKRNREKSPKQSLPPGSLSDHLSGLPSDPRTEGGG